MPLAGFVTAAYEYSRPSLNAFLISIPSSPDASFTPRMIWLKSTPLLPRAPMSAPCVAPASSAAGSASALRACSSAVFIVWSMFVPVSPSGTG